MRDITISNLTKRFFSRDHVTAFDDIDLAIGAGSLLVLLGPSGCGKTTLLRCVAGLETPQAGTIAFGDREVFNATRNYNLPTYKRDIGLVFQNYSLWPHMTVRQNVEYPLKARGVKARGRDELVDGILQTVLCSHLADRYPAMLSGGQQQRIALARALVSGPSVLLLDEPLSNLDALLRDDLRSQLRQIHRQIGFTGIYVTHDQTEAFSLGSAVAVMRAGKIEQLGTPRQVYETPKTEYVAQFLGIRNVLEVEFNDGWRCGIGRLTGKLGVMPKPGKNLRMYLRPEFLKISLSGEALPEGHVSFEGEATVADALYVGQSMDYIVTKEGQMLYALNPASAAVLPVGSRVQMHFPRDKALVYQDGILVASGS